MKPAEVAAVFLLVLVAAILLMVAAQRNNEAVQPSEPPSAEKSVTAWYYTRPGDCLEKVAGTFYGHGRYTDFLREVNQEKGVIEDSSLPSGTWLYVPRAIQNFELLGHPVGAAYEP